MFDFYYNRICHLRIAQPIINDITLLDNSISYYTRRSAISALSYITLKYQKELDKIAIYLSGRPIIKGQESVLYFDHTEEDLLNDLEYLIKCLIIIGAVRFGVEKSLVDAIAKINEE